MNHHHLLRGALLLAACTVSLPAFALSQSLGLCPIPGTLGEHLSHGNTFAYDPPGLALDQISGYYDPQSYELAWVETPAADSYLAQTSVSGIVIGAAGQADANYTRVVLENDGAQHSYEVQETWNGCTLTQNTRISGGSAQDWFHHQGTFANGVYHYTQERISRTIGKRIVLTGDRQTDGSWVEHYSAEYNWSDVSETWSGDADGNYSVHWYRNWGDSTAGGYDDHFRDGSMHRHIDYDWEACRPWFDVTIDYSGNGSGTALDCLEEGDDVAYHSCTMVVANGACTETCDNGAVFSCKYNLNL
jgi:hypothetical protein